MILVFEMVPGGGVEPPRGCPRRTFSFPISQNKRNLGELNEGGVRFKSGPSERFTLQAKDIHSDHALYLNLYPKSVSALAGDNPEMLNIDSKDSYLWSLVPGGGIEPP
jgi:hypothetical protein